MIELRKATKSYDGGRSYAVREVSLEVAEREVLVLLGTSGCGKTTTLKMINRLVEPTSGDILVNGTSVLETDPISLRRSIGYVFQGFGLFPHMTSGENVGIVLRLLAWENERIQSRVRELLELVHLDPGEHLGRYPGQLSGGQAQRVGFARALAAGSKVMLLDEPFGALDPLTRVDLQNEFRNIQKHLGLTTVMVTHDMSEALLLGDRIAVMRAGEVLQIDNAGKLLESPVNEYVAQMVSTPKRQADLLEEILGGA